MSPIKLTLLGSMLVISSSALAQNVNTKVLNKYLAPWQPVEITAEKEGVLVALPSRSITPEIYDLVIKTGVCNSIWTKDAPSSYLVGVKYLHITNQFKATGYSLETPLNTCKEMGDLSPTDAKTLMLSKTHLFTGSLK
ncbi:hypothetical protein [Buttiauxella ferragutiae]|uniref:hypothetical protein n=1 Tax=Buttiauxella ferragutiae TaxID=82989 RepID=UPI001F53B273|nr:hypothetical protein [Buttiauxella ferragutiae]UNK60769.1 hypothetical protein MNO13_20840 [Buttiauxella ferragutiae]